MLLNRAPVPQPRCHWLPGARLLHCDKALVQVSASKSAEKRESQGGMMKLRLQMQILVTLQRVQFCVNYI